MHTSKMFPCVNMLASKPGDLILLPWDIHGEEGSRLLIVVLWSPQSMCGTQACKHREWGRREGGREGEEGRGSDYIQFKNYYHDEVKHTGGEQRMVSQNQAGQGA